MLLTRQFGKSPKFIILSAMLALFGTAYALIGSGHFENIGTTAFLHHRLNGIKLTNGDVLLYSYDDSKYEPNGTITSSMCQDDSYAIRFEIYRAKSDQFEKMPGPHYFRRPNLLSLADGRVLIAGTYCFETDGCNPQIVKSKQQKCELSQNIEIFDPKTKTYSIGPRVLIPRRQFGQTLLKDGRVLMLGGFRCFDEPLPRVRRDKTQATKVIKEANGTFHMLSPSEKQKMAEAQTEEDIAIRKMELKRRQQLSRQAEIYDPKTNRFTLTGEIQHPDPSWFSQPVTLDDGRVLITGFYKEAEIYEPSTGLFRIISDMADARNGAQIIKLKDGRILFLGGADQFHSKHYGRGEIFNPDTETFHFIGPMQVDRGDRFNAILLKDGRVLITGGSRFHDNNWWNVYTEIVNEPEIFDPDSERFYRIKPMKKAWSAPLSFLLDDGRVLFVGSGSQDVQVYVP